MLNAEDQIINSDDQKNHKSSNDNLNSFLNGVKNVYTSNSNSKKKEKSNNKIFSNTSNINV